MHRASSPALVNDIETQFHFSRSLSPEPVPAQVRPLNVYGKQYSHDDCTVTTHKGTKDIHVYHNTCMLKCCFKAQISSKDLKIPWLCHERHVIHFGSSSDKELPHLVDDARPTRSPSGHGDSVPAYTHTHTHTHTHKTYNARERGRRQVKTNVVQRHSKSGPTVRGQCALVPPLILHT